MSGEAATTPDARSVSGLDDRIQQAVQSLAPAKPREYAQRQIARSGAMISRRLSNWKKAIDALQKEEFERIRNLIEQRNKTFYAQATPMLDSLNRQQLSIGKFVETMEQLRERIDAENGNVFEPYIGALESLRESIDIENLANFGMEEASELRQELDRLNSLAQLGIAVEIIGHELESYDEMIRSGLRRLPLEARSTQAARDIEFGCEGLNALTKSK
ncbi:hypothetical protein [Bradyrhizobium cosmicum]|uniref:hypothetical protein n=1 Tax=Bradyrhizobium cosmicum TaxID=1404864 RepID=UPI0028E6E51F|nr:hypothetical protein [Bradyrhizobium cosmicum]